MVGSSLASCTGRKNLKTRLVLPRLLGLLTRRESLTVLNPLKISKRNSTRKPLEVVCGNLKGMDRRALIFFLRQRSRPETTERKGKLEGVKIFTKGSLDPNSYLFHHALVAPKDTNVTSGGHCSSQDMTLPPPDRGTIHGPLRVENVSCLRIGETVRERERLR